MDIVIETDNSKSKSKSKSKTTNYKSSQRNQKTTTLVTRYLPHSKYKDKEAIAFNQSFTEMTNKIPKTNSIMIGADINVSIGVRDSKKEEEHEESNIFGPCGNPKKNKIGEMILNLLRQTDMKAIATYFDNTKT